MKDNLSIEELLELAERVENWKLCSTEHTFIIETLYTGLLEEIQLDFRKVSFPIFSIPVYHLQAEKNGIFLGGVSGNPLSIISPYFDRAEQKYFRKQSAAVQEVRNFLNSV